MNAPRLERWTTGWLGRGRIARAALSLTWRASPALIIGLGLLSVVTGLISPATAWLQRDVLDLIVGHMTAGGGKAHAGLGAGLLLVVIALCAAGLVAAVVPQGQQYIQAQLRRAVSVVVQDRAYSAVGSWPGIGRFESPTFADTLQMASQLAQGSAATLYMSAFDCTQSLVTATTFCLMLLVISPVLAAITVFVEIFSIVASLRNARRQAQLQVETNHNARRQQSFGALLRDAVAAKETRLFGLSQFLRDRMLAELKTINSAQARLDRSLLWIETGLGALSAAVVAGGLAWTAVRTAQGHLPIGDVSLFVLAAMGLQGAMNRIASSLSGVTRMAPMFDAYTQVVNAPPDLPVRAAPEPAVALRQGITVDDVWFRYDESHPWVLRGVSVFIPAGTNLGLVGLNGAGKSTLVKLLCRLYDPQRGTIQWDGLDIRDIDPVALRQRITAVFQDFMCYELTAAENIGIGDLAMLHDRAAIREAAVLAGADADVSRLPDGYDTMLSRVFFSGQRVAEMKSGASPSRVFHSGPRAEEARSGVLLSGGQRQRLALARSLMRADRDLLIMDEPMSNLDAESEHAVNLTLAEARRGRTCVLISHRLAAVREADRIVVLADGAVAEQGTHDELMQTGGSYARLFRLQAAGYRSDRARPGGPVNAEVIR